jgi:hypothetical protein
VIKDAPIEFVSGQIGVTFKLDRFASQFNIAIPIRGWDETKLIRKLADNGLLLYEFLELDEKEQTFKLDRHHPLTSSLPQWENVALLDQVKCNCGKEDCEHRQAAIEYVHLAWKQNLWFGLQAVGWNKELLSAAVFANWSVASPLSNPEQVLEKLAGPPIKAVTRAGSNSGIAEWLADMADQGHLHTPGPHLNEIEPKLTGQQTGLDQWQELLPQVKGVAASLKLIINEVKKNT